MYYKNLKLQYLYGLFCSLGHQNRHFGAQVAVLPGLDTKTAILVLNPAKMTSNDVKMLIFIA